MNKHPWTAAFVVALSSGSFDRKPQRDPTWTSYPYYASDWYSPIGRAFFLQGTVRVGGKDAQP